MKKTLSLGNLNIVWGSDESPFLTYWDEIVWPSLKVASDEQIRYKLKSSSTMFFLSRVSVVKHDDIFYLQGLIVKDTEIEIASQLNEKDELEERDIHEKAAPFSVFFINLASHRIGLMANQMGSPRLSNVKSIFEKILKDKVRDTNSLIRKNKLNTKRIPMPIIHLTALPIKEAEIADAIENSYKVSKVILDFFPLNGDIPEGELFDNIQKTRQNAESKSAEFTLNSPDNKKGVAELAKEVETTGTAGIYVDLIPNKGEKNQKFSNGRKNKGTKVVNAPIEIEIDEVSENSIDYLLNVIRSFSVVVKS